MASAFRTALILFLVLILYVILTVFVTLTFYPSWFAKAYYRNESIDETSYNNSDTMEESVRLLTLFTTALDKPWKRHIHNNTFINWPLLSPEVTPLLFYESRNWLLNTSLDYGWSSLKVPKTNKHGIPVVRTMYMEAQKHFNSHFYAYANADILFDESLIKTLKVILKAKLTSRHNLIVGRRTNVPVGETITSLHQVSSLSQGKSLFGTNAQDYFITTRGGYDWDKIPDFVVGRIGYDNWLVAHSILMEMATIDVTETVRAVHQSGKGGNHEGWGVPKGERHDNYEQAGNFDYSLGHTTCTEYKTVRDIKGAVFIQHRSIENTPCVKTLKAKKIKFNNVAFRT